MKARQSNLFTTERMQMGESIELTIQSIMAYAPRYKHWAIAWSGGKDSSTLLTLVIWLIDNGYVTAPETLQVFYADTRLELPVLWAAAQEIIAELKNRAIDIKIVMAPMAKRFIPYILGRGVPPPNNSTFRWCTRQIKVDPMKHALEELYQERKEKVLMLTGVRQGESAIRDQRIVMSCSKDGAECGQGWFQETMPDAICDTLAPILHWRVCHVWDWLKFGPRAFGIDDQLTTEIEALNPVEKAKHYASAGPGHGFPTKIIADAYGGDEAEEINARTGCMGCPLTDKDTALDNVIANPSTAYLQPLKRLRPIWRELRAPARRLRKTGIDPKEKNVQRMGPLTMEARKWAFDEIIKIQNEINNSADRSGKPQFLLINNEEAAFIKECWKDNVWPNRWDGTEPTGDTIMDVVYRDGTKMQDLFGK